MSALPDGWALRPGDLAGASEDGVEHRLGDALENVDPREYIGIAWHDYYVWTAYTGTWTQDEDNKALIWSSLIDWSE